MNVIISCFSINIFSKSFVRLQCIFSFLSALQTKCGIMVWLNCDRSLRRTDSSSVDFALVFFSNSSALSLQFFTVELIGTTSAFFSSSGKYFLNDSSSNDSISSVHLLAMESTLLSTKPEIHLPRRQEFLNLQKKQCVPLLISLNCALYYLPIVFSWCIGRKEKNNKLNLYSD